MTYLHVISQDAPDLTVVAPPEPRAPLVSIDLPAPLALELAQGRPVIELSGSALGAARMDDWGDALVGCMLLGRPVDALEVIDLLTSAGYHGQLTVVAPPLPDPKLVLRELRRAGRNLSVTMVEAHL